MSANCPRFVQIIAMKGDNRLAALDENGVVWLYAPWRPDNSTAEYKDCWNSATLTFKEAWPEPRPKLEECLIPPPTLEEEAEREIEKLLNSGK